MAAMLSRFCTITKHDEFELDDRGCEKTSLPNYLVCVASMLHENVPFVHARKYHLILPRLTELDSVKSRPFNPKTRELMNLGMQSREEER